MKTGWRESTWGQEVALEYGKGLRGYEGPPGRYRVYGSNGPVGWHNVYLAAGPGVILGRKGAYRGVEYSPAPFFVIDTAYYVRSLKDHHMRWLYYAIKYHKLGEIDDGSPVPSTTRAAVYVQGITVPPKGDQRRIADVLGSLDDKIELNRCTNATLEAMARTLFRSWFVDFDPVRAKADGQKPHGMDAATAALFPDSFEPSRLGPLPKGWRVVDLPEAIEVNPSRSLRKETVAPYLDMGDMPTTSARALDWAMRECGSGAKFANGDVLLARITPCLENGKTAFVDFLADGEVGWGSTEYIVLRSRPPLPVEYAYFLARSDELRTYAIRNMTGTSGRQRVPANCFNSYPVVVPPESLARRFGEFAHSVMQTMKGNDEQSGTLAATRDALLPKLLSGELRAGDAGPSMREVG